MGCYGIVLGMLQRAYAAVACDDKEVFSDFGSSLGSQWSTSGSLRLPMRQWLEAYV